MIESVYAKILEGGALYTESWFIYTSFDELEQSVAWGSFDGRDWLELGDRVFSFMFNENDNKRWHRERLFGQTPWIEWGAA